MILIVCSLLDKKSRYYKNPFCVQNAEVAIRSLRGAVNAAEQSDLTMYPEDFSLWQLATFNDETGQFTAQQTPMHLAEAMQMKKSTVKDFQTETRPFNVNLHKDVA